MKAKTILKKAGCLFPYFLCLLCLILLGSTIYQKSNHVPLPMTFGWGFAIVETGSMEPTIPVGALIVVHRQDTYQEGDIITYESDSLSKVITHRVIAFRDDYVIARGDANNVSDEAFPEEKIVGKVVSVLPKAGKALTALRQPKLIAVIITAICTIWSLTYLLQKRSVKRKEQRNQEGSELLPATERNGAR